MIDINAWPPTRAYSGTRIFDLPSKQVGKGDDDLTANMIRGGWGGPNVELKTKSFEGLSSRVLQAGVPSPAGSSHEQPPVPSPAAGHPGGAPFFTQAPRDVMAPVLLSANKRSGK
jgi:hypothetical protein